MGSVKGWDDGVPDRVISLRLLQAFLKGSGLSRLQAFGLRAQGSGCFRYSTYRESSSFHAHHPPNCRSLLNVYVCVCQLVFARFLSDLHDILCRSRQPWTC